MLTAVLNDRKPTPTIRVADCCDGYQVGSLLVIAEGAETVLEAATRALTAEGWEMLGDWECPAKFGDWIVDVKRVSIRES